MDLIYEKISAEDIFIDEREIWARLGGIGAVDDAKITGAIKEISLVATPAFVSGELSVRVNNGKCVYTDELSIAGESFAKMVGNCRSILFLGATLGVGVDRLIHKKSSTSVSEGYIFDAVASAMAEGLINLAEVKRTSGKEHTKRFSPGYGDMPLDMQGDIINILEANRLLGITLTESRLMVPSKSITALVGVK